MNLFRKVPFKFGEKDYEIRVYFDDTGINVLAFLNNHPANGYRHLVKTPGRCNVKELLEKYDVGELIEICREEIARGHWERLSGVIRECEFRDRT